MALTLDDVVKRQQKVYRRHFRAKPLRTELVVARPTVRVLKKYGRFDKQAKARGHLKHPKPTTDDPFEVYDATSGGFHADLSPMLLGPVLLDGAPFACNIEDGWQGCKVWSFHMRGYFDARTPTLWRDDPARASHDPAGDAWLSEWRKWSEHIRFGGEAKRHRAKINADAENFNAPLFSYFQGQRLLYAEARKRMYVPWYADLVKRTDSYRYLKQRFDAGTPLLLLDFDGQPRDEPWQTQDAASLRARIDDPARVFGHGFALAAALQDICVWSEKS